jgi:hypothetical protein
LFLAIDAICGKHIILKSNTFIVEMHTAIKHLYKAKIVKHLHSCLEETLSTGLNRLKELDVVEINSYGNKQGN